jgi:hypothetical protein
MEVIEVVRRWQAGESQRAIARATGLSGNTVEKYVRAAGAAGVGQGGEPPGDQVVLGLVRLNETAPPPAAPRAASLERQRERIAAWLKDDRLLLTRIHELLAREGAAVSSPPAAVRPPGRALEAATDDGADGGVATGRSGRDGLWQARDAD